MTTSGKQQTSCTVVVFAFNEQSRISQCLTSLKLQTLSVQALVVDNGSTDITLEIMRSHVLPHWTIHSRQHLPLRDCLVQAIGIGLQETTSEYFALLAGDDEWESEIAQSAVRYLENHPQISVAYPSATWRDGTGRDVRNLPGLSFASAYLAVRLLKALMCPYGYEIANLIYGVYRREAFESLREALLAGQMQKHGDDVSLAWEVLMHNRVGAVPRNESNSALIRFDKGHDLGEERLGLSQVAGKGATARIVYNLRFWWRMHLSITRALVSRPATRWWAPLAFAAGFFSELRFVFRVKFRF